MIKHILGISLVVIIIVSLMAGIFFSVFHYLPDWETRGQFGDIFGTANALFSGLAFTGLIYTIILQRNELSLQREELKLTRTELSRSAKAQEASEIALRNQAENSSLSTRLTAINFLLDHYQAEINQISKYSMTNLDPRNERKALLLSRHANLISMLDNLYVDITEQEIENEIQNR